jgi:hypothetical protein
MWVFDGKDVELSQGHYCGGEKEKVPDKQSLSGVD